MQADLHIGGLLTADPVAGFPPGTTVEMVHTTWQGAVQKARPVLPFIAGLVPSLP